MGKDLRRSTVEKKIYPIFLFKLCSESAQIRDIFFGTYPGSDVFIFCLYPSVLRIRDVYPGFRIRNFPFRNQDQRDSGSRISIKEFKNLSTQKSVSKLMEIWFGMFIPDPDLDFFIYPGSRIEGKKRHRIRNTAIRTVRCLRCLTMGKSSSTFCSKSPHSSGLPSPCCFWKKTNFHLSLLQQKGSLL